MLSNRCLAELGYTPLPASLGRQSVSTNLLVCQVSLLSTKLSEVLAKFALRLRALLGLVPTSDMLRFIQMTKSLGAVTLLLLGFLCLGRAIETSVDRNPNRLNKRETVTAGILLGLPAIVGGTWLVFNKRRQYRTTEETRLRKTFFELAKAGHGQMTVLQFAIAAQIDGNQAKIYLSDRSREYDATFQVDDEGTIIYCFNLGRDNITRPNYTLQ